MDQTTTFVKRLFVERDRPSDQELLSPRPLSAFFDREALVILGDPGAGKTTSFKQTAAKEPNAVYTTVRNFLTLRLERWIGFTVYLDALDEMRGRANDGRTVLDQVRGRLDELGCPRFRLSCRVVDWYGKSDATHLTDVSPDKKLTILEMQPLGKVEISQIISSRGLDPLTFIAEARSRGIYELLENPQTLLMVSSVVEEGSWPETKSELFQKATKILVREPNEEHRRAKREVEASETLLSAAGRLSAVILCSGAEGLALDEGAANEGFLPIYLLGQSIEIFRAVARRRLFRGLGLGTDRAAPVHRTVAEYLAAKYLYERVIHGGLPLNRVLSLITGHDGGTLSDLRGVYAWLTCICPQHANSLIPIDPLGAVVYGDVSALPPSGKRRVIDSLVALARRNPWFRSGHWNPKPFGGLSSPEMESTFREILSDRGQHPVAVSCIIHAIAYGTPLPSLGNLLLDIVRDEARRDFLRESALEAFARICSEQTDVLRTLLDDIHEGRLQDRNCEMREVLLRSLYPRVIGPSEVFRYVVSDPKDFIGGYTMFVEDEIVPATDPADLPVLLDAASETMIESDPLRTHSWWRLMGKLLVEGLKRFGENVTPERLYRWLGISLDRHESMMLEKEHSLAVTDWFDNHPERVRELFEYWLSVTGPDILFEAKFQLLERLLRLDWPEGFGQWFIKQAIACDDDRVAFFLFREGTRLWTVGTRADAPTLEELNAIVGTYPRFAKILQTELVCEISDLHWQRVNRKLKARQTNEATRQYWIKSLSDHLEEIRVGTHLNSLSFLAQVYFAKFYDVNKNLSPSDRIASFTNSEIAEAGLEGFVGVLHNYPAKPTTDKIIEAHMNSKYYPFGWVVLAGMDLLSERSMTELLNLPSSVLESGLLYHFVMGSSKVRNWVHVLLQKLPGLASEVLRKFWSALLAARHEHITGFHSLVQEESMTEVARRVAIPLLRAFPNCKVHYLEDLLRAALIHSGETAVLQQARYILGRPGAVRGEQRVLWYGAAFILNPEEFRGKVQRYLGTDVRKAGQFLSFIQFEWPENMVAGRSDMSPSVVADLVSICGRLIEPYNRDEDEQNNESRQLSERWHQAQRIRGLLNRLESDDSEEARHALQVLSIDAGLTPWRNDIAHASATQARKRRESAFQYPTFREIVDTLDGGPPANLADLQALVLDHLLTLRADIIDGPTDGYKLFWNVDSYGRAESPKPENICRDHLLERLRDRLAPLGIAAEPEGHFARDKRADIKVIYRNSQVIPVEVKRHYHAELWAAPSRQLKELYARDPAAGGRGLYLVFWFGVAEGRKVPDPPDGIKKPLTASELESSLRQLIPPEDKALIEILVVDCSGM